MLTDEPNDLNSATRIHSRKRRELSPVTSTCIPLYTWEVTCKEIRVKKKKKLDSKIQYRFILQPGRCLDWVVVLNFTHIHNVFSGKGSNSKES